MANVNNKENEWTICTLLMAEELGIKPSRVTLELLSISKNGGK